MDAKVGFMVVCVGALTNERLKWHYVMVSQSLEDQAKRWWYHRRCFLWYFVYQQASDHYVEQHNPVMHILIMSRGIPSYVMEANIWLGHHCHGLSVGVMVPG